MDKLQVISSKIVYGDLLETLKAILICAKRARREGLLSLDEMISNAPEPPLLFRIGIQLVVDGNEPETIMEILSSLMDAEKLEGDDMIEAKVIISGILGIQRGDNPRVICAKCAAHLGIEDYVQLSDFSNPFSGGSSRVELPEDTLFGIDLEEIEAREKLGWKFPRLYTENPGFSAKIYLEQQ